MIEVSTHQTIEQVLQHGFYKVPRFQRPYSWTGDNIGDFWSDTVQSDSAEYFIGAFIVYELEEEEEGRRLQEYAIVDGQQRLTTITILLAALRDAFEAEGAHDLAEGVQNYISRVDRRNQPRLIVRTEGGFPFFQARVQNFPSQETGGAPLRPDEKLIQTALNFFQDQLASLRKSVMEDSRIAAPIRRERYVEQLEGVRDRILGLNVILVIVDNEDDAYIIFETLNTRGKDLNLADLVRNFLLRELRETDESSDLPRARFNRMIAKLQDPQVNLDPSEFLLHSWNSRYEYTSTKRMLRLMKAQMRTRAEKNALLQAFENDVDLYLRVRRPDALSWQHQMRDIKRSARALRIFNMTQPVPVLLAALRAYENGVIRIGTLRRLFRSIEIFHFEYTAIAGKSSSGGISKMYALHARQFLVESRDRAVKNAEELIEKLRQRLPRREEFTVEFQSLGVSSTDTRAKPLVQYVLEGMYRHLAPGGAEVDFSSMTIEHIASERPDGGPGTDDAAIASIGNLIFVSEALNNRLGNRPFAQKREILAQQNDLFVDEKVLGAEGWDEDQIVDRARWLAEISYESVWRMQGSRAR